MAKALAAVPGWRRLNPAKRHRPDRVRRGGPVTAALSEIDDPHGMWPGQIRDQRTKKRALLIVLPHNDQNFPGRGQRIEKRDEPLGTVPGAGGKAEKVITGVERSCELDGTPDRAAKNRRRAESEKRSDCKSAQRRTQAGAEPMMPGHSYGIFIAGRRRALSAG
jgi:hypothetical protein